MSGIVLVAIDLHDEASYDRALPEAVRIARARESELHPMAVVPDFGMAIVAAALPKGWEQKALQEAKAGLDQLAGEKIPADLKWATHVGHGDIASEILRVAEEVGADMIIMESHPPQAVRQFLIGSQAERVVHHSPVSVLVLRR